MPKKYRLSGEEMRSLTGKPSSSSGKRLHGRFFSLFILPIPGRSAKCAVVVSKKVSGKAVDRNRVKRRARNVLAKRMVHTQKPLALILHAKREAKGAAFADIEHDIDVLFSKV